MIVLVALSVSVGNVVTTGDCTFSITHCSTLDECDDVCASVANQMGVNITYTALSWYNGVSCTSCFNPNTHDCQLHNVLHVDCEWLMHRLNKTMHYYDIKMIREVVALLCICYIVIYCTYIRKPQKVPTETTKKRRRFNSM
jgi:hypothetical protein